VPARFVVDIVLKLSSAHERQTCLFLVLWFLLKDELWGLFYFALSVCLPVQKLPGCGRTARGGAEADGSAPLLCELFGKPHLNSGHTSCSSVLSEKILTSHVKKKLHLLLILRFYKYQKMGFFIYKMS